MGVRTGWTLGERWSLVLAGDVGGISTSDQYSAEAFGLAGYRFGLFGENNANLLAGYRVLKQKYENGDGRSRVRLGHDHPRPDRRAQDHVLTGEASMNLAHRSRYLTMISCLAFVASRAAPSTRPRTGAHRVSGHPVQIENFYDANATEDDWACDSPQMQAHRQVRRWSARRRRQVRMAITYYFRSTALQEGQGADHCQGFNTRFFTFDKGPGGQLSLVKMSGPQRGGGA